MRSRKIDARAILRDLPKRPFDNDTQAVASFIECFLVPAQVPPEPNNHVWVGLIYRVAINCKRVVVWIESILVEVVE